MREPDTANPASWLRLREFVTLEPRSFIGGTSLGSECHAVPWKTWRVCAHLRSRRVDGMPPHINSPPPKSPSRTPRLFDRHKGSSATTAETISGRTRLRSHSRDREALAIPALMTEPGDKLKDGRACLVIRGPIEL